jgi:hypothetical protein
MVFVLLDFLVCGFVSLSTFYHAIVVLSRVFEKIFQENSLVVEREGKRKARLPRGELASYTSKPRSRSSSSVKPRDRR